LEIYVDLGRCICCHACEVACEREHGEAKISVGSVRDRASVPVSCHQCEVAPCALVCPSGALSMGETVSFDGSKCTRCGLCLLACPFGAIDADLTSMVQKCDLCPEREVPACVLTCPTEALIFGYREDATRELRRRAAKRIAQSYAAAVGRERA
jgi:Fe-S-cluster-containing hydrogenase component 2